MPGFLWVPTHNNPRFPAPRGTWEATGRRQTVTSTPLVIGRVPRAADAIRGEPRRSRPRCSGVAVVPAVHAPRLPERGGRSPTPRLPATDWRFLPGIVDTGVWAEAEWCPVGGCRVTALAFCAPSSAPRVVRMPELGRVRQCMRGREYRAQHLGCSIGPLMLEIGLRRSRCGRSRSHGWRLQAGSRACQMVLPRRDEQRSVEPKFTIRQVASSGRSRCRRSASCATTSSS